MNRQEALDCIGERYGNDPGVSQEAMTDHTPIANSVLTYSRSAYLDQWTHLTVRNEDAHEAERRLKGQPMTQDSLEDQRAPARSRLALMLGMYAGSQSATPLAHEPFMTIGNQTLTWLDMLMLTNAENPQQYCRRQEAQPLHSTLEEGHSHDNEPL